METRTGQYMHNRADKHTRTLKNGTVYTILVSTAYNAGGMIGSEFNGIAIIDETHKCVVLDQHLMTSAGGAPNAAQQREVKRLVELPDAAFMEFCVTHPRCRDDAKDELRFTMTGKRPAPEKTLSVSEALQLELGYKPENKQRFHQAAQLALRRLAKEMGLQKGTYEIRSNQGGVAVGGEVTLHTDRIYIQVSGSKIMSGHDVMYRTVNGQKDYTGGQNHFAGPEELDDTEGFARKMKQFLGHEDSPEPMAPGQFH